MCRRFESAPRHQFPKTASDRVTFREAVPVANRPSELCLVPKVGVEPTRAKPKGF